MQTHKISQAQRLSSCVRLGSKPTLAGDIPVHRQSAEPRPYLTIGGVPIGGRVSHVMQHLNTWVLMVPKR